MTGPENPTISVIIPVWNEARLVRLLVERLRAIDRLNTETIETEIIVADCCPSEDSIRLIRTAMSDPGTVAGGFRWDLTGGRWYYPFAT